jgi:hypothetical protein
MIHWLRTKFFGPPDDAPISWVIQHGQHVSFLRGHFPLVYVESGGLMEIGDDATIGSFHVEEGGALCIDTERVGIEQPKDVAAPAQAKGHFELDASDVRVTGWERWSKELVQNGDE